MSFVRIPFLFLPQAGNDQSVIDLILSAGLLIQLLMLCLVGMSVFTWAIVFFKRRILKDAEEDADAFEGLLRQDIKVAGIYRSAKTTYKDVAPARIFADGYEEALREKQGGAADGRSERVARALRSGIAIEMARLERRLPFLAITGSTAPFIGLFGTVWGIMRSFRDIGALHSADLAVVAPGIAEALIATAMGLFAAIPAVMAYNVFVGRLRDFRRRLEADADASLSLIERDWPTGGRDEE